MEVATWFPGRRRLMPPPLWMLTDGWRTVGPFTTTALVQGVRAGRVPELCGARPSPAGEWRALDRIREVRAARDAIFRRRPKPTLSQLSLEGARTLLSFSSGLETLEVGLRAAALELSAEFGFVHVFEGGNRAITRHAFGPGAGGRIGCPLLDADILSHVARSHSIAVGDVDSHHAFRVAASRLGGRSAEVRGVAMTPIVQNHTVVAMLELGRTGRRFRASDTAKLRDVGRRIVERIAA